MGPSGLKGTFYQEMLILFEEKLLILTPVCKTQHFFSLEIIASQVFLYELAANFSYSFLKRTMLGPLGLQNLESSDSFNRYSCAELNHCQLQNDRNLSMFSVPQWY